MQLPSIASLLNDTSPEKVVLPSVKELEQLKVSNNNQTPNIENSTVAVQQGFKSFNNNNTIPSSFNNLYPISNSQQVSNNNQTHNQLTSYTCTSSTQQQNIPSSNNNHYNYPPVTASTSQEDQRLQVSSTFLQQKDAYKNGMLKSHDIASDKYYDNYSNTRKWDESGSKLHSNPTSQPIPVYQNKWSTTTSNVSTSNSATFKPIISPTSRNSPLSFTPSIVTTASSSSSNVSETKKKRKHDESSESTSSPNSSSPKLVKRNSGTSKKSSNSSSSSAPTAVASSFQFMNFSISSDSSKIKFVNSEHQQIGINDGSWTDQEHDDFVRGLNECGKGRWREIAEKYVKTRTRTQVASHAQKYFEAQKEKKK